MGTEFSKDVFHVLVIKCDGGSKTQLQIGWSIFYLIVRKNQKVRGEGFNIIAHFIYRDPMDIS